MFGFVKKLLYRTASAIERPSDEKYYFIGRETKIDHVHSFSDFLLKIFSRKSIDVVRKFYRLIDVAAKMDNPDFDTFRILAAVSGTDLFGEVSNEGCEYLIKKAYRRGMSFRTALIAKAEYKQRIMNMYHAAHMRILRNSMYGILTGSGKYGILTGSGKNMV